MTMEPYSKYGYDSFKFEKEGHSNYTYSTILFPVLDNSDEEPIIREYERNDYKEIVVQRGSLKFSFYLNKENDIILDELESDAKFVCAMYEDDGLTNYFVYDGSYCNLEETKIELDRRANFEAEYDSNHKFIYKIIK